MHLRAVDALYSLTRLPRARLQRNDLCNEGLIVSRLNANLSNLLCLYNEEIYNAFVGTTKKFRRPRHLFCCVTTNQLAASEIWIIDIAAAGQRVSIIILDALTRHLFLVLFYHNCAR